MLFFRRSKGKPVSSSGSSDSASDSDGLSNSFQRKGQRKIAVEYWDNVDREQVEKLPEGINGVKVFVVKNVDKKKTVETLKDGRRWKKNCPTRWQGHSKVRYSDCKGSYLCENRKCPYRLEFGIINKTQFEKKKEGRMVCKGCGSSGNFLNCPARRYISYGKKSVTVYHCGEHTCPIIRATDKNVQDIEQLVRDNPNIKPSEIQSVSVISAFRQQLDWNEVEKKVESTLDRNWIANTKKKVKREMEPIGHDFEAVAVFKEYCDKKDRSYIYKINDRRGNPDMPSFVFKTSATKARMGLNMDREGDHFLHEEFCFFDGKRKRCKGYVTLTASVYHPLLRRQITLAVMESESENTENVTLFWNLFNEVLAKVSKDQSTRFNPVGWCTDMAGANLAGIANVFGEEGKSRIKSCEFHFKEHRNKMARKLETESSDVFKCLCNRLLESETQDAYYEAKIAIDQFISSTTERAFLKSWLAWWHDRRGFIFRAFAPGQAPHMNQAEVVHAGWVHRDQPNMSLLDACQADVRDAVTLDVEFKAYEQGSATGGTGPSYTQRQRRIHLEQTKRAKQLGHDMFCASHGESGYKIDPKSKHRPRNTATTVRRKGSSLSSHSVQMHAAASRDLPCKSQSSLTSVPVNTPSVSSTSTGFTMTVPTQPLPNVSVYGTTQSFPVPPITANASFHSINPPQLPPSLLGGQPQPLQWHSGMSPYPYELVPLPTKAQKCYGCGVNFVEKYRSSPFNIVVRHMDRRVIRRNEQNGQLVHSSDYGNTYYHPHPSHIRRKNPVFTGLVFISPTVYNSLDASAKIIVDSYEFNVIFQN